jgi:hypothetical protein
MEVISKLTAAAPDHHGARRQPPPKRPRAARTQCADRPVAVRSVVTTEQSADYFFFASDSSVDSAAMKASCGTSTLPTIFMRFLPSFCFSSSLRLREMSPP